MDITIIASGSSGNAYLVNDGETRILLDAGIPITRIQARARFKPIRAAFITHEHGDHCKNPGELTKRGTDVYTSAGTIEAAQLKKTCLKHRLYAMTPMKAVLVGTFWVLGFPVEHDATEPLGFLLISTVTGERLLYFTDTAYIKYRFTGITHLMAECNHDYETIVENVRHGRLASGLGARVVRSHMSLERLLDLLAENDWPALRQIYLLHLSNANSNEEKYKNAVARATGAEIIVC